MSLKDNGAYEMRSIHKQKLSRLLWPHWSLLYLDPSEHCGRHTNQMFIIWQPYTWSGFKVKCWRSCVRNLSLFLCLSLSLCHQLRWSVPDLQSLQISSSLGNHVFYVVLFLWPSGGHSVCTSSVNVCVLYSWMRPDNQPDCTLCWVSDNIGDDCGLWLVLSNAVCICLLLFIHNFFDSSIFFRVGDIECCVSQIWHHYTKITFWAFIVLFFCPLKWR